MSSASESQLIGALPWLLRYSLVFEKCLHPMNLVTDRGDGWAPANTQCFFYIVGGSAARWKGKNKRGQTASIPFPFFCAYPPQRIKTTLQGAKRLRHDMMQRADAPACVLIDPRDHGVGKLLPALQTEELASIISNQRAAVPCQHESWTGRTAQSARR